MKQRFISMPNVIVSNDSNTIKDSYLIDMKYVVHFELTNNVFIIRIKDINYVDEYIELCSSWNKNSILCLLMEMKLVRLMNYWHRKD
jgi:hypothetical protein